MRLIVCVDNNYGLMFNKRRVSRDKLVIEDILDNYSDIVCSEYSASLFDDRVTIDNELLNILEEGRTYFIEDIIPANIDKALEVVIYYWNRDYPADCVFDINLDRYDIVSEKEFQGNSHDKITKIVYKLKDDNYEQED